MSTSAAQLAANSANAQRATGPRTPDGKARSARNARTHGLTARDLVIAPGEREEFEELLAGYQADVQPRGAIQQTLFNELVAAAWNLRRIQRMETDLYARAATLQELDHLPRHKSRIERTFHRSLRELRALQTSALIAATLPGCVQCHTTAVTSAIEIAKRTQFFERRDDLPLLQLCLQDPPTPSATAELLETVAATA